MSYQNLRKGRFSETGRAYFITTVTRDRTPLFTDLACARIVIQNMMNLHQDKIVGSLSFVLMPDHLHWLLQLGTKKSLPEVIKLLKARSSLEINKKLSTTGSLWQRAYYDRAIRDGEDIKQIARYIIANPLRAGLVENVCDYPHWDAVWL